MVLAMAVTILDHDVGGPPNPVAAQLAAFIVAAGVESKLVTRS
jgi:hypothetical protein